MARWMSLLVIGLAALHMGGAVADTGQTARDALWDRVDAQIAYFSGELGFDRLSPTVSQALRNVPRHLFIPASRRDEAYENRPVPIGHGQTISQPLIVAAMTELLGVDAGDRVLEIGTGSGYQAAVLDALGVEVYSIEIIPQLAERARQTLDGLGHGRVETRTADGYFGWSDVGPFDAIIVTAASDHIPPPLIQQIKPGGRMLIPVGTRYAAQKLVLVAREPDGRVHTRELITVTFVPLTGDR